MIGLGTRILDTLLLAARCFLFAGLLLVISSQEVGAQWSSDPAAHIFYDWPAGVNLDFCTDGLGGAFFTFGIGPGDYYVGHINADGYQTMSTNGNYEHLQEFEPFPHWNWTVKLVPSLPGTVIAIGDRENGDFSYDGITVVKYDTVGVTGFGRIMVTDTTLHFDGAEMVSDQQGGVHLSGRSGDLQDYYYNHLSNAGAWRYQWPGYHISHRGGAGPLPDGYGGTLVEWRVEAPWPQPPGELRWQHFNERGDRIWDEEGRLMLQAGYIGGSVFLLEPGNLFACVDTQLTSDMNGPYAHRLFWWDTTGTDLGDTFGLEFAQDDSGRISGWRCIADKVGGFFFNRILTPPSVDMVERYDGNASLEATSEDGEWIHLADGLGGGYRYSYESSGNVESIAIRRYAPDLQRAWPEPTVALASIEPNIYSRFIVADDHRLIGMTSFDLGFEFYNVNPDGSLGPRLAVGRETPPLIQSMELVAYPNPFNSVISILVQRDRRDPTSIVVYDVLGRVVTASPLLGGNEIRWAWDAHSQTSGSYYILLQPSDKHISEPPAQRITLVR